MPCESCDSSSVDYSSEDVTCTSYRGTGTEGDDDCYNCDGSGSETVSVRLCNNCGS